MESDTRKDKEYRNWNFRLIFVCNIRQVSQCGKLNGPYTEFGLCVEFYMLL